VRPRLGGGLTSAEAGLESPYGPIEVGWTSADGRFSLTLTVPPGSSAQVDLPDGSTHQVGPGEHAWTAPTSP
jgi:alpha-L-rhamnosidase